MFQGNSDRSYIGHRVSREFGRKICDGTVDKFDSRRRRWKITYDYGEVGEMDHREILYAIDLFDGKDEAMPIERPTRRAKTSRCNKRLKNQSGNDVQLFAFKYDDPTVKQEHSSERPKRKLKAIRRFDPLSYDPQAHCPTGHGFACPRCSSICSYDSRECEECYLECCYEPGVGVVVLKERKVGPRRPRQTKHVGIAETPFKEFNYVPPIANGPRKSVEDVTDIVLEMKKEQRQKMVVEID